MTIKKKKERRPVIDLGGPQGNAFWLLAYAKKLADELYLDGDKITAEMRTGNYENLINVFDKYFGEYVDLER